MLRRGRHPANPPGFLLRGITGGVLKSPHSREETLEAEEERDLLMAAREGDSHAFALLVKQHDRQVLSQALNFIRDRDQALDIYQEVFMRAYRGLNSFRFDCRFASWLRKITVNVCLSTVAREGRSSKLVLRESRLSLSTDGEEDNQNPLTRAEDRGPDSYRKTLSRELRNRIEEAVEELSPQQRAVFVQKHFEGRTLGEIANSMEIATGTVKKHLFEAVRKMRERLEDFAEST